MLAPLLAPSSIEQSYTSYLGFAAIGLAVLLPVVSILTLTSEWGQRSVLTTFTQEPRRTRVINAKVIVSLLLAGSGAVFGGLVTAAGLGLAAASGRALEANLNAGIVVGFLAFVLLNVLTGVAYGALLHNSAAAIVVYFALPTAFALLGQAMRSLAEWIDSSITFDWILAGEWAGHTPPDPGLGVRLGGAPTGHRAGPHGSTRDQVAPPTPPFLRGRQLPAPQTRSAARDLWSCGRTHPRRITSCVGLRSIPLESGGLNAPWPATRVTTRSERQALGGRQPSSRSSPLLGVRSPCRPRATPATAMATTAVPPRG